VSALQERYGDELEIEILTTMPNRYKSYQRSAEQLEIGRGIIVHRFHTQVHKSGFIDQSRSFLSYARQVLSQVRGRDYDLVYATSSRLMTAALGAFIARRKEALLYLDIRDLFADTMDDVLGNTVRWLFLPIFRVIEKYTFREASAINVVSPGFKKYFVVRGYGNLLRFYTNGIDDEFLDYDFSSNRLSHERPVILYAGNIGAGQGLDRLIPDAARLLRETHTFKVVGDGGAKAELVARCEGLDNVHLQPPVDRESLKDLYAQADILLMHLNDYEAFRKVLPSKIFEYAATGKPVLAGVAGYAAKFTQEHVTNSAVFSPCDARGLVAGLNELNAGPVLRDNFKLEYSRASIMQRFAKDVICLLRDTSTNADIAGS